MPSIPLDKLEEMLYRESGCVAAEDVPALMVAAYEVAESPVPQRLLDEAEANNSAG